MLRPFQTGSRNNSYLMSGVVKHIEVDINELAKKGQKPAFCVKSAKSYRQQIGY